MKKYLSIVSLTLGVLMSTLVVHSQTQRNPKIDSLHFRIYDYWQSNMPPPGLYDSEFFFVKLTTDNKGEVKQVNFLADTSSIALSVIRTISLEAFRRLKLEKMYNSSILIPVFCNGSSGKEDMPDYSCFGPTVAGLNSRIVINGDDCCVTSGILLFLPYKEKH